MRLESVSVMGPLGEPVDAELAWSEAALLPLGPGDTLKGPRGDGECVAWIEAASCHKGMPVRASQKYGHLP
jgi:hypothetical protein